MTLRKELEHNQYPLYKAYWPDGKCTDAWGEDFEKRCEKYADYEATIDHEYDYDEEGNDYGVTYLYVHEKDAYDKYD